MLLATIGVQSVLDIMRVGPIVSYFTLIVVGVHVTVTLGAARLMRDILGG